MSWRLGRGGRPRRIWWWLLGVVVLVVAARLAAPPLIAAKVRRSIETMEGGYRGSIDGVELSVLGGEVAILGMRIEKANGKVPAPFMDVKRFVLGVEREGFKLRQTLRLVTLRINYVDAQSPAAEQWGPKFELVELRDSLPLELGSVYINDGEVHLRNFEVRPAVDVYVSDLELAWEELAGCLPPGWESCSSSVKGKASVMGSGALHLVGTYDRRKGSDFDASGGFKGLKLAQFNPALLEYAKIDAQRGSADVDLFYTMHGQHKRLLLVPRIQDVEIAGGERERTAWLREVAAGLAAGYFERKSGKKAIEYEARGGGKGAWSIVDWPPQRADASGERAAVGRAARD
jgi:Domain of Unknown Function (DUF748)